MLAWSSPVHLGIVHQWNNPKCQFSDRFLYNVQWTGLHGAWCSAAWRLQWQCSDSGGCSDIRPDDGSWYNPPRSGDHKQQHTDNPRQAVHRVMAQCSLHFTPTRYTPQLETNLREVSGFSITEKAPTYLLPSRPLWSLFQCPNFMST